MPETVMLPRNKVYISSLNVRKNPGDTITTCRKFLENVFCKEVNYG